MAFLSRALRSAETFLEHVDERVVKASKQLTINDAVLTGEPERRSEIGIEDSLQPRKGARGVVRAEDRILEEKGAEEETGGDGQPGGVEDFRGEPPLRSPPDGTVERRESTPEDVAVAISEDRGEEVGEASQVAQAPVGPVGPVGPVSAAAVAPVSLQAPEAPEAPEAPDDPVTPVTPAHSDPPLACAGPTGPEGPVDPVAPEEYAAKVGYDKRGDGGKDGIANDVNMQPRRRVDRDRIDETARGASADEVRAQKRLVAALQEERDELRVELEMADQNTTVMSKALKDMKDRMGTTEMLEETIEDLEEELRKYANQGKEFATERAGLERKTREEREARQEAETKADVLAQELESVRRSFKKAAEDEDRDVAAARREAIDAVLGREREIAAHNETRLKLQKRIENLETDVAANSQAMANAERAANEARLASRESESALVERTRERDEYMRRSQRYEETLAQADRMSQSQQELVGTIEALEARVGGLETEIEYKQAQITASTNEARTLREMLNNSNQSNATKPNVTHGTVAVEQVHAQLRSMADSTMRLQGDMELLRGENRALKHQLDTERRRAIEAQAIAAATSSTSSTGRGARRAGVIPLRPAQNWPLAVVRSLESLDNLSTAVVLFLRREPIFRLFVLVYVVFMHLFIYALLHSGASSAHSHDYAGIDKP